MQATSPPSLLPESSAQKCILSPVSMHIDDSITLCSLPLSPSSYYGKKHHYHHSLFATHKNFPNHIDLKAIPPINTTIHNAAVHSDTNTIDSNDASSIRSTTQPMNLVKGFINTLKHISTTNFSNRSIGPLLSFDSNSYLPQHCTPTSDDDIRTIDFEEDNDNTTVTEHTFNLLRPLQLQIPSLTRSIHRQNSEYWSLNTPTDYTQFRLYGATALSPFKINKKSFLELHKQDINSTDTISYFLTSSIPKMSTSQTIFTVVNVYVNNTMLFNSYALKRGGLFSVLLFGLLCFWLCYSGKLIVHAVCSKTTPTLYQYMGWCFSFIMSVVIVLENIGRTIVCLITMWQNILYIVRFDVLSDMHHTKVDQNALKVDIAMISSAILLLPTVWMLSFSDLVFDSILGFISTWSLALIVAINFYTNTNVDAHDDINIWPQNTSGLVLCFGIFIANLAGHSCLPAIYSQMEDQTQYNHSLNVSWIIIFVIEMTTGIFGYFTYGSNTKILITESMMETSVPSTSQHVLSTVLTICLVINLFVHVPIGVAIASQLPENVLQLKHHLIRRVFRTVFFIVIVYTAWLFVDDIAWLSAFIGSILTLTISMLCPLLAKVYLDVGSNKNVFITIVIIVFGSFSVFMLYILFHFHTNNG